MQLATFYVLYVVLQIKRVYTRRPIFLFNNYTHCNLIICNLLKKKTLAQFSPTNQRVQYTLFKKVIVDKM